MLEFLAIALIVIIAVISPGPDFAMVTRNSLQISRRAGIYTAIGIALGVWVHVTYSIIGIGIIIQQSILLFNIIKLLGAAYLIFLGFKMLQAKKSDDIGEHEEKAVSDFSALKIGFFTNALNPKTTIFMVSIFAQIIDANISLYAQLAYGGFISFTHLVWFALVAFFFSHGAIKNTFIRIRHWVDRAFGALLVAFGVTLALSTAKQ